MYSKLEKGFQTTNSSIYKQHSIHTVYMPKPVLFHVLALSA